ncbi:MAG TPA: acyl-CoA dehydrogenase [Solirubrobacteraceae bacterium]|nr:acyl-CoA dehydrogenase [Solirubrobacteraceae bacterium]
MALAASTTSTLLSRRDLRFLLHEWLGVERLSERPRYADQSAELYDDVLELAEQLASDKFAPHNRSADAAEPSIGADGRVVLVPEVKPAVQAFAEAGLLGTTMPESVGGMGLPHVIGSAAFAWFQAANVGTSGYPFLTVGAANLLLANGSREQIETWVTPMVEGRFFGTMCLSETQAGSSLADITTRAEPQADGTYRLFGTKMWISGGDHELSENIVHLVLAKLPGGPAGVKGISLLIVPRFLVEEDGSLGARNDVVLAGLNHKMGYRGTVNTVLGFGEGTYQPGGQRGAVGYLVGEEHRGLTYMFHMMNEARIGVGLGATCLGYTGYLKALRYARERPQGRLLTARDPSSPQVPIIEHADVKRMLLAQKAYVEGALALVLYCGKLLDDEQSLEDEEARAKAHLLLEVLTPITKSWPSQWCLEANSLAIQVHGGYGYAREYDVEQHYRDNRLNPIHEGTHGIQGLDLLGRKVTMQGGAGLGLLTEAIGATVKRATSAGGEAAVLGEQLGAALQRLLEVTAQAWGSGEVAPVLANATAYLEATGHTVVAWLWLEQWLAADGKEGDFYDGKRQAARYFFRTELPKTGPQLDLLARLDRTSLEMQDAWF